jgi:hypothetical protein
MKRPQWIIVTAESTSEHRRIAIPVAEKTLQAFKHRKPGTAGSTADRSSCRRFSVYPSVIAVRCKAV